MSKRKTGNNIHGIILLNKRLEISSNKALQEVRRLFNANKAGHTGSLDPLATGLLPLCFGEATKVSNLMLDDNKRYTVRIELGIITDTGDKEGQVLETNNVPDYSLAEIQQCLTSFIGEQEQIPPMYSALKYQGKKLYELAREGKTIERQARLITLFEINLLQFEKQYLTLDVFCSKGTYIRSLAEDIGQKLGCGATVNTLHRTQAGQFKIEQAYTLKQLSALSFEQLNACLLPVDMPLQHYPFVYLDENQAKRVQNGQAVAIMDGLTQGWTRIYFEQTFLGLGEAIGQTLAPKRLFNLS
jgi:tRNA pseudouridine55 synthase